MDFIEETEKEKRENIGTILEELAEYASLEGDELGEMLSALITMYGKVSYTSEEFTAAVEKELREQIAWLRKHVKIVEREVKESYTIQELEFDDA